MSEEYSLHLQAHDDMERFKQGIGKSKKIYKLLQRAREWRFLGDSQIKIRFKWRIIRISDGVVIAQSK